MRNRSSAAFDVSQDVGYGFAELYVPVIGLNNTVGPIRRLSLVAAARYENYYDVDDVITPKLGATIDIGQDITLSSSWGRSFKAPTFYQLYAEQSTLLRDVTGYGTLFPAGSTFIQTGGANDELQPEKSENWSSTIRYRPSRFPGAELSMSYFDVDYTDRITVPISSTVGTLNNPLYAELVTLNPSVEEIDAYVSRAVRGLQSIASQPYDPSRVVAILDARNQNVARQTYSGVDVSARYRFDWPGDGSLTLSTSAAHLESEQQLKKGLAFVPLTGTVFNPVSLRARGGAVLEQGNLILGAFVTYTDSLIDSRRTTPVRIGSVTTLDLNGRLKLPNGLELAVSALNLFNAKPDAIYTSILYDTSFDTTNYSAAGRFLGASITKAW